VNWILDADIKGFFDHVSHEWLLKFIGHRVADDRMPRLIQKWLKAGVSEEGRWSETTVGTPQGAVVSPLLANVYLHYVFDLWAEVWREKVAQGDVIIVRYAVCVRSTPPGLAAGLPKRGYQPRDSAHRWGSSSSRRLTGWSAMRDSTS
jgi:hypothetical protein